MKLINIGFGNMVSASRLVAIVSPESAPIKRIMQDAKEQRNPDRRHLRPPDQGCDPHRQRPCDSCLPCSRRRWPTGLNDRDEDHERRGGIRGG